MNTSKILVPVLIWLIMALFLLLVTESLSAQASEGMIRAVRDSSNAALKALDEEANMRFLTNDVLITTGSGSLLSGKDELLAYIESATGTAPMYWIRTPEEIIVNEERGLAWETGVWNGYSGDDRDEENPLFQGNYAAQWVRTSNQWKIQSQLFVTLN